MALLRETTGLIVIICDQHKVARMCFEVASTLVVLDDCAASKDVRGRTGELVKLGFSARYTNIRVCVLTQQLCSITKPFREKMAALVLFYTPSAKTTKTIFDEYAGELFQEALKLIASLKERKFLKML